MAFVQRWSVAKTVRGLFYGALFGAMVPGTASAEGSAEFDARDPGGSDSHDQAVDTAVVSYVDILNNGEEKVCWSGTNQLVVSRPNGGSQVDALSDGDCTNAVVGVTGAYDLNISGQSIGTEWDVRVCASTVSDNDCLNVDINERLGRLWSHSWEFESNTSFAVSRAVNGSVYAIVPGGALGRDAVIEMEMTGVSGAYYKLFANSGGPETDPGGVREGRSVPKGGYGVTPEYPLYLNPPEIARYNWIVPQVTDVELAPQCGNGVVLDTADGTISFDSNVEGQYVVICDANTDGVLDFASDTDFSSFGDAVVGPNTITWDGRDNDGTNVAEGNYNCVVRLNVGEFHYIAEDIETSYPGIRMFRVEADKSTRTAVNMFWDDGDIPVDTDGMNEVAGQISPTSPMADGLNPGAYADTPVAFYYDGNAPPANPVGNARAWGNFNASGSTRGDGKGQDAFLDQFSAADTDISAPFVIRVITAAGDDDSDGLLNARECELGADPQDEDSDDDGVNDGFEADATNAPNTDGSGPIDVLDPDDDGDGIPTADELGGEDGDGDPTDADNTDGAGKPDYLDTDSDGDGVDDGNDVDRTDPNACRDVDTDNCDDCAQTGADGSGGDPDADGADTDGDQVCNLTDPDDDDDGICDDGNAVVSVCAAGPDTDPLVATECSDSDGDGCDDCSGGAGSDPANDGPDSNRDGQCDAGDPDDDGVPNNADQAPNNGSVCRDLDGDNCDDCTSGTDAPGNDGTDTDGDGLCDVGDGDDDGDGVDDGDDSAPLNRFECRDEDNDSCNDCVSGTDAPGNDGTDTDGDGICDAGDFDLDSDGDGVPNSADNAPNDANVCRDADGDGCDDCSGGSDDVANDGADMDGDGICDVGDSDLDSDGDGVPNSADNAPDDANLCRDVDGDGCDDCSGGSDDVANDGSDMDGDGRCDRADDFDGDGLNDLLDLDDDGDGIPDVEENILGLEPSQDVDGDGIANFRDADDRGDGMANVCADADADDVCDRLSEDFDADQDGKPNHWDLDADGDEVSDLRESGYEAPDRDADEMADDPLGDNGLADAVEDPADSANVAEPVDSDDDGLPDFLDPDDDGDGVPTQDERTDGDDRDTDGDGKPDHLDTDDDGDGVPTQEERTDDGDDRDTDGDGESDHLDVDDDGDGVSTADERTDDGTDKDSDGDGKSDHLDVDDDGDGVSTADERTAGGDDVDTDKDGTPDHLDVDDDGDGIPTIQEHVDLDEDGIPDRLEPPAQGRLAGGALCTVSLAAETSGWGMASMVVVVGAGLVWRRRRLFGE